MKPAGLLSPERNLELALLLIGLAFVGLGWRALDAAEFPVPAATGRIVTQFTVSVMLAHIALRMLAPRTPVQPLAVSAFLAGLGLIFVIRLVPEAAQDQANWITIGVVAFAVFVELGRRHELLARYTYTFGAVALGLLVLTGLIGEDINGARLWITVAGQTIQTTELIKLFVLLFLAGYLADRGTVLASPKVTFGGRTYSNLPYLVPLLLVLLATIGALALLKDLGSVALLVLLGVCMLYMSTGRARYLVGGVVLLAVTGALGYLAFDHAQVRIDAWLDPQATADTSGYQTLQATYAIQAGGVTGEGLGLGQPDAIPAVSTDYVFSAITEELGMAGAVGVVLLYVLFLYAGVRAALAAGTSYGRLLGVGVALLIAIQAGVIVAGNLRLIPTTGITLPFVSYGGSSLVVNFALLGLLMGLAADRRQTSVS